jgi:LL-diaminopimelate aminotransferase
MLKVNENFLRLKQNYLFGEIAKRVSTYKSKNPNAEIIRLGIGDIALPLVPVVTAALHKAVDEMGCCSTFKGYPPEQGYEFLRTAVADFYKTQVGVIIAAEEVFISDGAKNDCGNLTDIFGDNDILIQSPVYPVYVDSNIMAGRPIKYVRRCPQDGKSSVIYLCSPNNPTGEVQSYGQLKQWVDFAQKTGSIIIFDSAYQAFITGDYPRSIFEIDGAKDVAIEINSFSKSAGFTGVRCSFTIVPKGLTAGNMSIHSMWCRRQATKFNGVSYIIQKAAAAVLSGDGLKQARKQVSYYLENAKLLADFLKAKKIKFTGGDNAPYIWLRCPNGMSSWEFFDFLLTDAQIVGTPGVGFGKRGENYFRLSAFACRKDIVEAIARLEKII